MELKQEGYRLSDIPVIEVIGSILIFASIFLPWMRMNGPFGVSEGLIFSDKTIYVVIFGVACFANVALKFFRRSTWASLPITLCGIELLIWASRFYWAYLFSKADDNRIKMAEAMMGKEMITLDTGYYLALFASIVMLICIIRGWLTYLHDKAMHMPYESYKKQQTIALISLIVTVALAYLTKEIVVDIDCTIDSFWEAYDVIIKNYEALIPVILIHITAFLFAHYLLLALMILDKPKDDDNASIGESTEDNGIADTQHQTEEDTVETPESVEEPQEEESDIEQYDDEEEDDKKKWYYIGGAVAAMLIVIIVSVMSLGHKDEKPANAESSLYDTAEIIGNDGEAAQESDNKNVTGYKVEHKGDKYLLMAEYGEKVVDTGLEIYDDLEIYAVRDLNGDGNVDLVASDAFTGTKSDLYNNPFIIYYDKDSGKFKQTDMLQYSDAEPKIEEWKGMTTVCQSNGLRKIRYALKDGKLTEVDNYLKIVGTVRHTIKMDNLFGKEETADKTILVDFDNDGEDEKMTFHHGVSHAECYGAAMSIESIEWSDGRKLEQLYISADTFMLLEETTNGMPDMISGDWLLRWNGSEYNYYGWNGKAVVERYNN